MKFLLLWTIFGVVVPGLPQETFPTEERCHAVALKNIALVKKYYGDDIRYACLPQ